MSVYLVKRLLSTPSIEPDGIGAGVGDGGIVGVIPIDGVVTGDLATGVGDGFKFAVVAV
jgi:hypothetical protein